jgi:hypothetical protein
MLAPAYKPRRADVKQRAAARCPSPTPSWLRLTRLLGLLYLLNFAFPELFTAALFETATNKEPAMRKRQASLNPSSEGPALPILPAQSRFLVRQNC